MGIEKSVDTLEGTMASENTLIAGTEQPEKIANEPEHGTRTPENKELPRTITGWKVTILLDACL